MKKLLAGLWLMVVSLFTLAPFAFADSPAFDINNTVAQVIVLLIVTIVPILAGYIVRLLVQAIRNSQSQTDDRLAAIAVAWAEDQLGKGEKLDGAAKKLSDLSKGRIKYEDAKVLIAATYQSAKKEWADLKK